MRTASGSLTAILNSGQPFFLADLLTITTSLGVIYRWTSADADLVYGGNTYQNPTSSGVIFKRGSTKLKLGLEVDTMDLTLSALPSLTIGGIPFMQAVSNGYLDGAQIHLERAVMSTFGDTSPGTVWLFDGITTQIQAGRYSAKIQASSTLYLMDTQYPTHIHQSGCVNTLFQSACGVVKGTYQLSKTLAAGSTASLLNFTDANPSSYFALGEVIFTSGPNTGASRTIRASTAGTPASVALTLPLSFAPQVGDAFLITPGCNKLYSDTNGCPKFSNQGRYRGCPEIPVPETAR